MMFNFLLTLIVISICCTFTTADSEANVVNVASKDELLKIMIEMSTEIKKIRLEHKEFLQMRKELLWTQEELQRIQDENFMKKSVMGELVLVKQELLKTKEELQVLKNEREVANDIQTNILNTLNKNTLSIHSLDIKATTSEEQIRKVLNFIEKNEIKDKVDQEYSDNNESNENVQAKRVVKEYLGSERNDKGVKRSPLVPKVAFTTGISSTLSGFSGRGQAVVFDNVQLNIGNGYDKNSGIFRAPVAGLYIVLVTISTDWSSGPDVVVVRNGSRLCATIPSSDDHSYAGSPCNVIVQLMEGDEVWVQEHSHVGTDKIRNDMWSTFSIALLSMDGTAGSS